MADSDNTRSVGHTPGPWHAGCFLDPASKCQCSYIFDEGYCGGIAAVYIDNGKNIADGGNDCPPVNEARANARLIAAAPDMKLALERIWLTAMAVDGVNIHDQMDAIFGIARNALAELAGVDPSHLPVPSKPMPDPHDTRIASARQTLLDLADRCEREEGSRELDGDIFEAVGGSAWKKAYLRAQEPCGAPHDIAVAGARRYAPDFTSSLDAAVTLVPTGARFALEYGPPEDIAATVYPNWDENPYNKECAFATSLVLALCAASLRSRAQEVE